tara:strand:- start:174 stop:320 length:147 start_codon:yes stop_codon:yes gene_type:complete
MDKVTTKKPNIVESTEAFIKRLSDSDDNFIEDTYDGYVLEIDQESYDP